MLPYLKCVGHGHSQGVRWQGIITTVLKLLEHVLQGTENTAFAFAEVAFEFTKTPSEDVQMPENL